MGLGDDRAAVLYETQAQGHMSQTQGGRGDLYQEEESLTTPPTPHWSCQLLNLGPESRAITRGRPRMSLVCQVTNPSGWQGTEKCPGTWAFSAKPEEVLGQPGRLATRLRPHGAVLSNGQRWTGGGGTLPASRPPCLALAGGHTGPLDVAPGP